MAINDIYTESTDCLVYLNGTIIEYIQLVLESSIGQPTSATIVVEADPVLITLLPRNPLAVFVRNPNNRKQFILAFEGYTEGIGGTRDAQGNTMRLTAVGSMGSIGNGSPLMSVISYMGPLPIFGGNLLGAEELARGGGDAVVIPYMFLNAVTDPENNTGGVIDLVSALIDFIDKLSVYNIGTYIGSWKSGFFRNVAGITSPLISKYIELSLLDKLLVHGTSIPSGTTLLGTTNQMLGLMSYSMTQILFPSRSKDNKDRESKMTDSRFSPFANEMLVLPDLSYAFPPPSNWVFPAEILTLSWQQSDRQLPTRKLVVAGSSMAANMVVMSPSPETLGLNDKLGTKRISAFDVFLGKQTKDESNPFAFNLTFGGKKTDDKLIDIKSSVLPIELLKGVVKSEGLGPYSEIMALARTSIIEQSSISAKKKIQKTGEFYAFLQKMADYQLAREARGITANITLKGNLFIVPGLTAFIIDNHTPLMGTVTAVTCTFEVDGGSRIEVTMEECIMLNSIVYNENQLQPSPLTIPEWGIDELVNISDAQEVYKNLIGTTHEYTTTETLAKFTPGVGVEESGLLISAAETTGVDVEVNPFGEKFSPQAIKKFFTYDKWHDMTLRDALIINNRDVVTLEEYNVELFEPNLYLSLWDTYAWGLPIDRTDAIKSLFDKSITTPVLKANTDAIKRYAEQHKGGKCVYYRERDPFGTRPDQKS